MWRRLLWGLIADLAWGSPWSLLVSPKQSARSRTETPVPDPSQKPAPGPLGLNEADENLFRNLLARIREHDPVYMAALVVEVATNTQPPNTVSSKCVFDSDEILTDLVIVAKGTGASARVMRLFKQIEGGA